MADDLSDVYAEIRRLQERVRILETANPLEAASITSGRVRFIGGQLRIDAGGNLLINGTLAVNGSSTVTGSFTVSGPWNLSGNGTISGNVTATGTLTQNGPWNLNGAGTIAGDVNQTGNTTQQGNVNVSGGGKITVAGGGGNVVLDSSFSAPRIQLGGSQIDGGSSSITFTSGTQVIYFFENTIRIPAMATKPASSVPGGFAGAVHADSSGKFFRLT